MVTIIMPIYNEGCFLKDALESILNQTYGDFELLCINDASTDNTSDVLESFRKRDNRIHIINNSKNLGAGTSRNIGISMAKGEYIAMLDGDDFFDKDLIKLTVNAMDMYESDLVFYDITHLQNCDIGKRVNIYHGYNYLKRFCSHVFSVSDCNIFEHFYFFVTAPWNKLYRTQFLRENNLCFYELPWNEDVLFSEIAVMLAKKCIKINTGRIMAYGRDHDSPTRISNNKNPWCSYVVMKRLAEEIAKRGIWESSYQYYFLILFKRLFHAVHLWSRNDKERLSFYNFLQEKGLDEIIAISGAYYQSINGIIKKLIEEFRYTDYNSGWRLENPFIKYSVQRWKNEVCDFLRGRLNDKRKIAMWGIGANAILLLEELQRRKIKIHALIDIDKNKWFSIVAGYNIYPPHDAINDVDLVVFVSPWIYKENEIYVKRNGKEAICLIDECPTGELVFDQIVKTKPF